MRRIFGAKQPAAPPPTIDESCDRMDMRTDKVNEKIQKLEEQLLKYKEQIQKTRPGAAQDAIKKRALQVLRQKKLYEGQRETLYGQQMNMEQSRFTIDNMKDTVGTVQAIASATKDMKTRVKKNKELQIDYIDKVQDDMFDLTDMSREINESLSRSYDVPEDLDESSLMDELDGLEGDMGLEDAGADATPSYLQEPEADLPAAPTGEAAGGSEQELGLPAMRQ